MKIAQRESLSESEEECVSRKLSNKLDKGEEPTDQDLAIAISECRQSKGAALVSSTNVSTQVQPLLCKKNGELAACKQSELTKKTARLKIKMKIAQLRMTKNKIKIAAEGDTSTSQSEGSPDGPNFVLKKIKRTGFPEGRGVKEKVAILKLASQDKKFAKYYLIDSQDINGNGWGVTESSIQHNIQSFVGMPFVVTAREWIPNSPYEDQFDHPFIPTNSMDSILAHQELFRVGNIVKVAKEEDNGKWYAMIQMNPKFAHMSLPPFCSPAVYQTDPHEPEDAMTKWIGLHLAGLMSDPAYGPRVAILRGSCVGNGSSCSHQFRMAKQDAIKPVEQVDQSGLSITETDKEVSPLSKEKKEISIKNATCACPIEIAKLRQRISKIKKSYSSKK